MTLEEKMRAVARERKAVTKQRSALAGRTGTLVRQAAKRGWTKDRIGRELGITRQTVHEMMRKVK